MRVMLVDDEPAVLKGLSLLIDWDQLGMDEVILVENAVEALAHIKIEMPDLLITDVNMPVMNGLELIKEVRELSASLPIIVVSGYDEFEYAKKAIEYHVESYILKPIDEDELVGVIERLMIDRVEDEEIVEDYDKFHQDSMTYKVLYYLHHHYDEPIKLKSLATTFHMTPAYLGQIIKKSTGELFNDYLLKIRMKKAVELLESSHLMVYEVGYQCGYKDTDYFIKKFTSYTGMSPKTYKNQHMNQK